MADARQDPGGFIVTAIIGIAGSFLATWIGQDVFRIYGPEEGAGESSPC